MAIQHTIKYAFCKWADRISVLNWIPLYNPISIGDSVIECDAFGRGFGEPYYGTYRHVAEADVVSPDLRYYRYVISDDEVLVYKEEGHAALAISAGSSINRLTIARPYFNDALHLIVETSEVLDFSTTVKIIDTKTVAADRAKVLAYTGAELVVCPSDGMGGVFSGQPVVIDMTGVPQPTLVRYKWVSSGGDSDWYFTPFPTSGEAYVSQSDPAAVEPA